MIITIITHRIHHGAAIYGNMDPINIPPMLAYIPAPWILWVTALKKNTINTPDYLRQSYREDLCMLTAQWERHWGGETNFQAVGAVPPLNSPYRIYRSSCVSNGCMVCIDFWALLGPEYLI
jgi:hypothetical protein